MNVVIDIGNTATKLAVFKKDKMLWLWHSGKPGDLKFFHNKKLDLNHSIISSVAETADHKQLYKLISSTTKMVKMTHKTTLPFKNRYKTPKTLGLDRIAAVAGAWKRFPGKNVLVIDAGTCIKYDIINKKGEYLGGSISPGLHMRFLALHNYTHLLPLVKPEQVKSLTGDSTKNSILTGVIAGMTNEMNGFIGQYRAKYHELKVILTGGDAPFLGRQLKSSIFAAPYLTLEGLNEILKHNVE